ncbi:MAG: hypothetical protein M3O62_04370 [Pseudomonadota bacterium]|nr:hypothetical protein [Pseudomonadota bacterium]
MRQVHCAARNTRTLFGRVLLAGFLAVAAPLQAGEQNYDRYDARVSMSDGVELDASLYIPRQPSPKRIPLIVRQHGGGSNKDSPYDVQYGLKAVATNHFALLTYSARGHGDSGGLFDFFGPRTTRDFSEMLDWVAANYDAKIDTNNVGAAGYSQGGGESLLPAEQDARVKALAVGNTFSDLNYALNPNDAYKFAFATGIFVGAYSVSGALVDYTLVARWGAQLNTDTEDIPLPPFASTTDDLAAHSPLTYVDALIERRVPVFWTNAWEDQLFPADHPERILSLLEAHDIPVHYWFASGGHAAGPSYLPEEELREQAMLDWFEQYLNGDDRGFGRRPKVDYWQRISGTPRTKGEWEHYTAAAWPIPDAKTLSLHPHADGSLASEPAAASETAPMINDYVTLNVANDALTFEIAANVPGLNDLLRAVPEGKNPLDTITYTSAPLTEPLSVAGAPELTIVQDSTRLVVQQFAAKVWDLSDDGAQLIWRGAISGPLEKQVSFRLWPNAHRFEIGHRIVLTISSVDFPTFKPDIEPWRSNIQLAGTRLDLPVRKATVQAAPSNDNSGGGSMAQSWLLLTLLLAGFRSRFAIPQRVPLTFQNPVQTAQE